ncbi:MAG: NUDIX domain-containing protein [Candidatus Binatia bacterium]
MSTSAPVTAKPAATVVLLRNAGVACEVLLVRRSAQLKFHGGAWVFPGGRIEEVDYAEAPDVVTAARRAAVREAREEAGLVLGPEQLVLVSRWITPVQMPIRFDAWFFAALGSDAPVAIDGDEIHEHQWMAPADALAAQRTGAIDLPPPTFVTLSTIAPYRRAEEALAAVRREEPELFEPRLYRVEGGAVTLYAADAGYEDGDLQRPGPRHRLWMLENGWRYERSARGG